MIRSYLSWRLAASLWDILRSMWVGALRGNPEPGRGRHSPTPNPLHPNHMTAEERVAELGQILARGLIRIRAQKSNQVILDGDLFPGQGLSHG